MKIRKTIFSVLIGLFIVTGCASTIVTSITSLNNKKYFKESPSIVAYKDKHYLRFVYTDETFAYFIICESKVNAGSLIYYLPVTTSTGNYSGRIQFQEILKTNEVEIIKKKNVYWKEPDGSLAPMIIEQLKVEEIELLPKIETEKQK